jgi:coenzyme F420-0:L-glutamate ligase/coenzyme F420-1:gamma-L-glutamate ligase
MGEANEGTPVAIIRGYQYLKDDNGIKVSFRPDDTDLVKQALIEQIERQEKTIAPANTTTGKTKLRGAHGQN